MEHPHTGNIYLTFKVLRLVNTFHSRLKTRVQSHKQSEYVLKDDVRRDFEKHAYARLHEHVPNAALPASPKIERKASIRAEPTKHRSKTGRCRSHWPRQTPSKTQHRHGIDWLLREVDHKFSIDGCALSTVAKEDKRFVSCRTDPTFDHLNLIGISRLLAFVDAALGRVRYYPTRSATGSLLCHGDELELTSPLDEKFVANLEHLLLRIRSILVQLLVRQAYALLQRLSKALCGRTTSRAFDYYAEFPSGRRPLSTTWPWSIKPSLAVLWGVCWMFFNSEHETTLSQESYVDQYFAGTQAPMRRDQTGH
ncbi:hypothetical protein LTR39_003987, partial [Cryomyces antarcticus]